MDSTWYYVEGDKTVGPLSLTDIRTILSRVSNAGSVFVWRDGFTGWMTADSVAELAPSVLKPPPLPPQRRMPPAPPAKIQPRDADVATPAKAGSSTLHPWRRYFARMFDLWAFVFIFFVILGVIFPELFQTNQSRATAHDNEYLYTLWGVAAYVIFEAICLNTFGTTFGKFIYGIRIKMKEADQIPFLSAVKRCFFVWLRGLGLSIPLISLITLIVAYNNLLKNGETSWDRDFNFVVLHSEFSAMRWFAVAIAWLSLLGMYAIGFALAA
jgi:hypothetical protein